MSTSPLSHRSLRNSLVWEKPFLINCDKEYNPETQDRKSLKWSWPSTQRTGVRSEAAVWAPFHSLQKPRGIERPTPFWLQGRSRLTQRYWDIATRASDERAGSKSPIQPMPRQAMQCPLKRQNLGLTGSWGDPQTLRSAQNWLRGLEETCLRSSLKQRNKIPSPKLTAWRTIQLAYKISERTQNRTLPPRKWAF